MAYLFFQFNGYLRSTYERKVCCLLLLLTLTSCTGFRFGWGLNQSKYRDHLVKEESQNYGYKRISLFRITFHPSRGSSVNMGCQIISMSAITQKGEYELRIYYVGSNTAYIFIQDTWNPASLYLSESREMTWREKLDHAEMVENVE